MSERDTWLEWRRLGLGASDIAGILGISPWASPWSVWADKAGLLPPEPENEYMAAGRWLERAIGPWFEDETGLTVAGEQTWCTHYDHAHHRCTVDGFVHEAQTATLTERLGVIEIKVTGPGKRWEHVPEHYQAQAQWQMYVTDSDNAWVAVLMGRRLDIHELARDQADISFMVGAANRFWTDHVLTGTPPATDGHDATLRALAEVYPTADPDKAVEVRAGWVQHWRDAKDAVKAAKAWEAEESNAIKAHLGDAEEGTVAGQRVVSWRNQTRTTTCPQCDHKTTSEFRVLRLHLPKETL